MDITSGEGWGLLVDWQSRETSSRTPASTSVIRGAGQTSKAAPVRERLT